MNKDQRLIYTAAFLRAFGVGVLGVLFALYLSLRSLNIAQIGVLVAVGLAGSATGTFGVGLWADRLGRRRTLLFLCGLMAAGAVGLVVLPHFWGLAAACFVGMVNSFGRERGAVSTLEQAILPELAEDRRRTQAMAWYNVTLDAGLALGSLAGGLPLLFRSRFFLPELASYQWTLALYGACLTANLLLYACLTPRVEIRNPVSWKRVSPASRKIITRISLLFGFDSLAGGFLPASLIAFWFFKRFGVREEFLAPLFFAGHVANAFSHLGAAWLSRRIGLVRTMVFTHAPSHFLLIALPFVPTLAWALPVFLLRECLVEMDLPTRQSYLMAVVAPPERTVASSVSNLPRLAAWTVAPSFAGLAMNSVSVSLPLFIGGGMKIVYDTMLFFSFRPLRPPEEQ